MNILNARSLSRGSMFADIIVAGGTQTIRLTRPECVGVVAACNNYGWLPNDIQSAADEYGHSDLSQQISDTITYFNHWAGGNLWSHGPADDDFSLGHPKLRRMFPKANVMNRQRLLTSPENSF